MSIVGRAYVDPGDRLAGRNVPPRRCVVLVQWRAGARPRNVLVRYIDDNSEAVIPFARRLRREDAQAGQLALWPEVIR